jgi:hypothetical protein
VDFSMQMFGGTKNFLPHALAAWEGHADTDAARREADARVDEQRHRERDERERRQRLADMRASLTDAELAALRRCAEETLAADGVDRTRLGYDVLVKLTMDDLLERNSLRMAVEDERESLDGAATAPHADDA